jgi:hypothetical protein
MTSAFGILTDYTKGTAIRAATAAEWRETAAVVNSGDNDAYAGVFFLAGTDLDVYVDGGPDAEVCDRDIEELWEEADAAGDLEMARVCERALGTLDEDAAGDGGDPDPAATAQARAMTQDEARGECVRVILDSRAEAAADNA